jgi:hypothetical protein
MADNNHLYIPFMHLSDIYFILFRFMHILLHVSYKGVLTINMILILKECGLIKNGSIDYECSYGYIRKRDLA